jgi:hypothetical protein
VATSDEVDGASQGTRCRRVIVVDESPERVAHDNNYHHRARPCKEGVPNPRRRQACCSSPFTGTNDMLGRVTSPGTRRKEVLAFFYRLADRRRITRIRLAALDIGLDVLRRCKLHRVPELGDLAPNNARCRRPPCRPDTAPAWPEPLINPQRPYLISAKLLSGSNDQLPERSWASGKNNSFQLSGFDFTDPME